MNSHRVEFFRQKQREFEKQDFWLKYHLQNQTPTEYFQNVGKFFIINKQILEQNVKDLQFHVSWSADRENQISKYTNYFELYMNTIVKNQDFWKD